MRYVYSNEIYHYGIPGMKWGIRRFQNPDGTLTAAGRRRYGTVENLERGMTKKQAAEHEAAKKAAINSGKTAEVQKFSSELTREEMAYAVQRIRDEQTLSDLRAKDVAAGQQRVKAIIDAGGQLKTAGETVKNVYNLVAQANNAFNKNHTLPVIGENLKDRQERQAREFDTLLRTKNLEYFKNNSGKFTSDELKKVIDRFGKEEELGKKVEYRRNQEKTKRAQSDKQSDKSEKTTETPTYSQPSQERASKKSNESFTKDSLPWTKETSSKTDTAKAKEKKVDYNSGALWELVRDSSVMDERVDTARISSDTKEYVDWVLDETSRK